MFSGYLELGGNELINSARVAAYVQKNAPLIPLRDVVGCGSLAEALGEPEYQSPKDDQAPWFDANNPASARFWGVYPLVVEGVDDSTLTAEVTEGLGPGGFANRPHDATRPIRVRAVLVADDQLGMDAGMTWLKSATRVADCTTGDCGGAEMCYFVDCPNLCRQWWPEYAAGSSLRYTASPGSPFIMRHPEPGPIFRATMGQEITSQLDGQIVRWGALDAFDFSREVESYGPVVLRRTNFVPEPSFTRGLGPWGSDSSSSLAVRPTGGVDGGAYLQARIASTARNFIADPSLEHFGPDELGWQLPSGYLSGDAVLPTRVEDATAPDGDWVASFEPSETPGADPGPGPFWAAASIPLVGSSPSGTPAGTWSLRAKGPSGIIAVVLMDPEGVGHANVQENLTGDWQLISTPGDLELPEGSLEGWSLLILWLAPTRPTAPLLVDELLVCDVQTDFFSGDSQPGQPEEDDAYRYADGTPLSASEQYKADWAAYASTGEFLPTAGPSLLSFAARSSTPGASLSIFVFDDEDDRAWGQFSITDQWQRYSLPANISSAIRVAFQGGDGVEFDLDQVMFEAGSIELPYLDGDEAWEDAAAGFIVGGMDYMPEYTVTWLGDPSNAPSQMVWNGAMTVGIPFGIDPDDEAYWGQGGICDAYAFVEVLQGDHAATASFAFREEYTLDEKLVPYGRTMYRVSTTSGVRSVGDIPVQYGVMREVEFYLTATHPYAYGATTGVVSGPFSAFPTHLWGVDDCPDTTPAPIVDPDCPAPPAAPRPPDVPNSCVLTEDSWRRYWVPVRAADVSMWSEMAPQMSITSGAGAIREVRVRAFRNPFGRPIEALVQHENRIPNPKLGINATGWGLMNQGTATGRVSTGAAPQAGITSWYRATANAAHDPNFFGVSAPLGDLFPGEEYKPSIWARPSAAKNLAVGWQIYDASMNLIHSGASASVAVAANAWARLAFSGGLTAPANSRYIRLSAYAGASSGNWASGQTLDATGALANVGEAPGATYYDGDTEDAQNTYYQWAGPEEASASMATSGLPIDPCDWCSEFILSYLPPNTELIVDAVLERATASVAGGAEQPADNLLYGSDGGPMTWPALTCGIDYLFAIDVPPDYVDEVSVSLSLTGRYA